MNPKLETAIHEVIAGQQQDVTDLLKKKLWDHYGSTYHPAEWDGNIHGGGKCSQRYWEYLKTIELLDLASDSSLLDIGSGTYFFFPNLVKKEIKHITALDENGPESFQMNQWIDWFSCHAHRDNLKTIFSNRYYSHISCISVLEHIDPYLRKEIFSTINDFFLGDTFVFTCEYHPTECFFEHQLTTKTLGELTGMLTHFYCDEFIASPTTCENAVGKWYPIAMRFKRV